MSQSKHESDLARTIDDNITSVELSLGKREKTNLEYNKIKKFLQDCYPFLDSANLTNSTIKWIVDLLEPDNDQALKYILSSGAGIGSMITLTLFLSTFAYIGGSDTKNKSAREKEYIAFINMLYKDIRELMQSTKYAFKATRIVYKLLKQLAHVNLPLYTMLGVVMPFVVITRIWVRHLRDTRKEMLDYNKQLFKVIGSQQIVEGFLLEEIKREKLYLSYIALTTVCINATIDGLYNYYGLLFFLVLPTLPPPVLIALLTLCAIYTLALVVSRTMEEYHQQLELEVSALDCELLAAENNVILIQDDIDIDGEEYSEEELKARKQDLEKAIASRDELYDKKKSLASDRYIGAFLKGLQIGLSLFSILGAGTALLAALLPCFGIAFPPMIAVFVLVIGCVCIEETIRHYLMEAYEAERQEYLLESMSSSEAVASEPMAAEPVNLPLTDKSSIFEQARFLASGFSKSFRLTSQYEDSILMKVVSICFGFFSAVVHGCYSDKKSGKAKVEEKKPEPVKLRGLSFFDPKPELSQSSSSCDDLEKTSIDDYIAPDLDSDRCTF